MLSLSGYRGPLGPCSGFQRSPPPHSLSRRCRVMLDSVTHSTFLPNTSFCDPLMSWTDLFCNEEYYPAFEHQTGRYAWGGPSELGWAGAGCGAGLGWWQDHARKCHLSPASRAGGRGRPEWKEGKLWKLTPTCPVLWPWGFCYQVKCR